MPLAKRRQIVEIAIWPSMAEYGSMATTPPQHMREKIAGSAFALSPHHDSLQTLLLNASYFALPSVLDDAMMLHEILESSKISS